MRSNTVVVQYYNHLIGLIGHRSFAVLFLFLLSFGIFSLSLRNGFVWDDIEVIEKNYYSFKSDHIASVLIPKGQENVIVYYRPMVLISMIADWSMWGLSPFGFHLSNIIFNSISTVVLYFLALVVLGEFNVEGKEITAFLSALLFAIYPMHVESVSWVAGRTDVLCGVFFFLAFVFHVLSYRRFWFLVLAAFSFSLSLLSKEVALAFPIVAIGFDLISRRYKRRENILKYCTYAALVFLYFYLRRMGFVKVLSVSEGDIQQSTHNIFEIGEILRVILSSYLFYIWKLVFPFEFNAFITDVPRDSYYLFSSVFVILALCITGFVSIMRKRNITGFTLFWVFATLGPSCIIAFLGIASTPLAERYLYIPSAGYCMLVGYLILESGKGIKAQRVSQIFCALLCLSYLFFTIDRQGVWKDSLSLWEDTSRKSFYYGIPHSNYGMALIDAGRIDEAIRELLIALNPEIKNNDRGRADAANDLGIAYGYKRDYRNAAKWFHKALYYYPTYAKAYYHLGLIYFIMGEDNNSPSDYQTAESYLKKALEIYPSYGRANLFLAKVYMKLGERKEAREQAKMALRSGLIEPLSTEARDILNEPEK